VGKRSRGVEKEKGRYIEWKRWRGKNRIGEEKERGREGEREGSRRKKKGREKGKKRKGEKIK
jgi:hypothetical protein